jgi:hypothetical protein
MRYKLMLEREIEKALVAKVKRLGGICEKFTSPGRRSCPDRIVSLPGGRIIFVECKRPGGKPTDAQKRDHLKRRMLGCEVVVIDCIEEVNLFPKEE